MWTGSFISFILVSTMFLKISINIKDVNNNSSTQQVAGVNTNPLVLDDLANNKVFFGLFLIILGVFGYVELKHK